MSKEIQLSGADRRFCQLVAQAAFANPFGPERAALDIQIIGPHDTADRVRGVQLMREAVSERIRDLEATGQANIKRYRGEERYVMQTVLLFDVYHRFYERFDRLIQEQIQKGDAPCKVSFAEEALSLLTQRGFDEAEALRFFAILYQIRRAHYFIAHGLLGRSPCMQEFRRHLWNNVFTHDIRWYDRYLWNRMEDFSTLLLGETGTGKGTAAAAIGRSGFIPFDPKRGVFAESFTRSFTALNLSQFPEAIIESELFGHRKGAFTGAIEAHEGILARCSPHGAIFLDEIGEVSVPIQIKLLQVLQDRTFSAVGSHEKLRFQGRVIAATNRPLQDLRRAKAFRDDFFYRLCSDTIIVPPLRERLRQEPLELDELLEHALRRLTGERSGELQALARETLIKTAGSDYPWPGNVRELEQAVRRILLTKHYEGAERVRPRNWNDRLKAGIETGALDAGQILAFYCASLFERHGSFEEVARRTRLDWRTAKKYVLQAERAAHPDSQVEM